MDGRIGIGIITHNRKDLLAETIQRVRHYTTHAGTELIVADDGSTDGTAELLRAQNVPRVGGANRGIAWNKNRALYLLGQVRRCDVVILLEDDTQPSEPGWEQDWIAAARRWGHINFAAPWMRESFETGRGTVEFPFLGPMVTAQCAAYARAALDYGGYFDTSFTGYGHEHVEHSRRLLRSGYGGTDTVEAGVEKARYAALASSLIVRDATSHFDAAQVERNLHIAQQAMADASYRVPWRSIAEMQQFRAEITATLDAWPDGFALHAQVAKPADGSAMDYLRGRVTAPPNAPATPAQSPPRGGARLWSWWRRR